MEDNENESLILKMMESKERNNSDKRWCTMRE